MRSLCVCVVCGVQFTPKDARWTTCCSRACGFELRRMRAARAKVERQRAKVAKANERAAERVCTVCAATYNGPPDQRYCSDECRREKARRRYRIKAGKRRAYKQGCARFKPRPSATCHYCGHEFTPRSNAHRAFCSTGCAGRLKTKKRWALEHGAAYTPVSPAAIYARDGWVCGICRSPVRCELRAPDPNSPTLDHIVPLSRGGTHEPSNLRLAHFGCNSRRGNRLEPQPRGLTDVSSGDHIRRVG